MILRIYRLEMWIDHRAGGSAHQRRRLKEAVRLNSLFSILSIGGIIMMSHFLVNTNLKLIFTWNVEYGELHDSILLIFFILIRDIRMLRMFNPVSFPL
jgi:hypothetical protein